MSVLMRSISGIRGIVGESLTPLLILEYLNAFLQVTEASRVVIGRDTRTSGSMLESLVAQGCAASNVKAFTLGISSTPTVEMMVPQLKAEGGIIITASHNPAQWNALKFLNSEGVFLNEDEIQKLFTIVDNRDFKWGGYREIVPPAVAKNGDKFHVNSVLNLPIIHPGIIRKKKFKIAYDAVNGAGYRIIPQLLSRLNCECEMINVIPDGLFPHDPEPTPGNLRQLRKVVKEKKCDAGFATDPDVDRCAVIDENGRAIGEEYTLALAARLVLKHQKGPVTMNLSTSRMNEDIAAEFGVDSARAKVGEINVTCMMKQNGSVIGGEGNGGVIYPDLHYGRDAVLAIAMVLQLMAEENKSISELISDIPRYHIEKQKIQIGSKPISNIFGRLLAKFHNARLDEKDGLRFEWDDKWVHVRASNTEPVIRVIAEAPTRKEAIDMCEQVTSEI